MKRFAVSLVERSIAIGFWGLHLWHTPNPFKPFTPADLAWTQASPEEFYAIPTEPPRITFQREGMHKGAFRERFTFPSAYVSPHAANNTVHGLANLRAEGKSKAALVLVHGHTMTHYSLLEWYARPAIQMGFDVYFLALPYHMQRAPAGSWGGQYSLNADVVGSAMTFMQGVRDLRALVSWITQERQAPVVLGGVSLGAYTCCMTAVVDERPRAVLSILGGGSLARILMDGYQLGRSRRQLAAGGVTPEQLEQYWKLLGPGNWKPRIARERVLLLAGKYDPIVTPGNVEHLWQAWDQPRLHWYEAGHGSIALEHHAVREDIFRFLINCV